MTKKHYEIVAAAVASITTRSDRWLIANKLANGFEKENPRFDRDRFIAACRPTDQTLSGKTSGLVRLRLCLRRTKPLGRQRPPTVGVQLNETSLNKNNGYFGKKNVTE